MALTEEKLQKKRHLLIERTAAALQISSDRAIELLSLGRTQSIRINTILGDTSEVRQQLETAGIIVEPVSWADEGFYITDGQKLLRESPLVGEGKLYIQNAASWLPVLALDPKPGEVILDMCAAPGGKTSHIAQKADNKALITANDNSRPRLHKLQSNLQRLGVENVTYTLHDATRLARQLEPESFDKILLDAPCSGEGMMTLSSNKDFESWSVAHIKRLQQLQKKLLVQAWQLLKPGGRLVYSTCTMAPEENEAVIDYLLRRNEDATVENITSLSNELDTVTAVVKEWNGKSYSKQLNGALRLIPSPRVEAFFVIALTKQADFVA